MFTSMQAGGAEDQDEPVMKVPTWNDISMQSLLTYRYIIQHVFCSVAGCLHPQCAEESA